MSRKAVLQSVVLLSILLVSFAGVGGAQAWSGGCTYYTVKWGDTLSQIAQWHGTNIYQIQSSNPGLGYWVYAGQVLCIPSGYQHEAPRYDGGYHGGGTYIVQWGDTFHKIAMRFGVSDYSLQAANPQIWNTNWIYAGQVIYLPAKPVYYTVCYGDTLKSIANRYGTNVYSLLARNPQIWNANWIYAGQVIRIW